MQTKIYVNLPVKDLDRSANPDGHMWEVFHLDPAAVPVS